MVQNREFRRIEVPGLADHEFCEVRPCVSGDRNSKLPIGGNSRVLAMKNIFRVATASESISGTYYVPPRPASVLLFFPPSS